MRGQHRILFRRTRNCYEHILRDAVDYERTAGYILDHPAHWNRDEENLKASS